MKPISAPGQEYSPDAPMPEPFMAGKASPNPLRMVTVSVGVERLVNASTRRMASDRIRPCSTDLPTMNPGTSIRNSTGRLKASHRHINRIALRHASGIEHPGVEHGVVGHDPHREPIQPAQTRW